MPRSARIVDRRPDQRFARGLFSVLRDSLGSLSKVLCRELKAPTLERLQPTLSAEGIAVLRSAKYFAIALRRLLLLLGWQEFTGTSELPRSKAVVQYVRILRRRGVRVSLATLYAHLDAFRRRGFMGLVPKWKVRRLRRTAHAERVLLERVLRGTHPYRIYSLARIGAGLTSRPINRSSAHSMLKEMFEDPLADARQRASRRRPSARRKR